MGRFFRSGLDLFLSRKPFRKSLLHRTPVVLFIRTSVLENFCLTKQESEKIVWWSEKRTQILGGGKTFLYLSMKLRLFRWTSASTRGQENFDGGTNQRTKSQTNGFFTY